MERNFKTVNQDDFLASSTIEAVEALMPLIDQILIEEFRDNNPDITDEIMLAAGKTVLQKEIEN